MPGYDRTGPWGEGPRTGGGFGYCGGNRPGLGRGLRGVGRGGRPWGGGRGRCFGGGRGWSAPAYGLAYGPAYAPEYGGRPYPFPPSEEEALRAEAENLRAELKAMEERLAELEKEGRQD